MQILLTTKFGQGSGVTSDLFGVTKCNLVCGDDEIMLLVGEILSALAQGSDIEVTHFEERSD